MIETQQTVLVDAPVEGAWNYVQDIHRWANLMPGCKECEVVNERESRWTLKVGAGGLVRTVKVLVHVDEWDGPGRVNFSFNLEGDPVNGGGSYIASSKGPQQTEVTLQVRVIGSGPMAPMWEAMSKPLLPQLVKSFAGKLKAEIEKVAGTPASDAEVSKEEKSLLASISKKLSKFGRD